MTNDQKVSFETIERPDMKNVIHNTPDFNNPLFPAVAEFAFKASKVLTDFRNQWLAVHVDDLFAKGIELDLVPVMLDGMIMGYMGLSEIDGKSYDYYPVKSVDNKVAE